MPDNTIAWGKEGLIGLICAEKQHARRVVFCPQSIVSIADVDKPGMGANLQTELATLWQPP